jgi:hypothetical protein
MDSIAFLRSPRRPDRPATALDSRRWDGGAALCDARLEGASARRDGTSVTRGMRDAGSTVFPIETSLRICACAQFAM